MMRRNLFIFVAVVILGNFDLVKATPCTVEATGQSGECKFMTDCPVALMEYQKLKKMPTLCDKKFRTVCCPMKVSSSTTTTTTQTPRRVSERKCREYGQLIFETTTVPNPVIGEPPIMKKENICARDAVELIVGGTAAKEREFPHMALIGFKEGKAEDFQCGGSLISAEWVLSAGHCGNTADGPARFVKLGNIARNRNNSNTWTYNIIQRMVHPAYSTRLAENDIALFKLDRVAKLSKFVIPLCLPQADALTTKRAIATGWGRQGFGEDASDSLMKVTIEYFEQARCNEAYEEDEKLDGKSINFSKIICAGSTNKTGDTCNGDSGGPLQIFNNNVECMYTIVGITSYGSAYCGAIGIPAIYTKVFFYLDWIESIVWPNQ